MSDILRQVDEDIRKDKLINLWKNYGLYVVIFFILAVGIIAALEIRSSILKANNEKIVENYIAATAENNIDNSISILTELKQTNNSFVSSLSSLQIAQKQIQKGNRAESKKKLEEIINNPNADQVLVDLSIYYYLMMNITDISIDEMNSILDENKIHKSKFKYLYQELIGIKYLILDNLTQSKKLFEKIKNDAEAPREVIERAKKFIDLIA